MAKPSRAVLHAARIADAILFWPVLGIVLWGELQPDLPSAIIEINDKLLHFGAYFVLGAMAAGAIRQRGRVKWAVLGLILTGTLLEGLQAYVGRDTSVLDALANAAGAIAGAVFSRLVLDPLRQRWGYGPDAASS
jgi:VanZ family protein